MNKFSTVYNDLHCTIYSVVRVYCFYLTSDIRSEKYPNSSVATIHYFRLVFAQKADN